MIQKTNYLTSQERLNNILDKINEGIKLDINEKRFLDSWKTNSETHENELLNQQNVEFISDDGNFKFTLKGFEIIDDCKIINGTMTVPDPEINDILMRFDGNIIVFKKKHIAIDFRIKEIDIFEILEGREEKLDDFVGQIIKSI